MPYPLVNPPVGSVEELEAVIGTPIPAIANKVRDRLDDSDRAWIAHSPLVFIATSDAEGRLDVSPKGDPGSVALVLDDTTLVIAERPGNRRADGFRNLLQNPRVGLLFVEPGRSETLRVAGRARIARDEPFFDRLVVRGHRPALALVVDVEEVFLHCAKAFARSQTWNAEHWAEHPLPAYAAAGNLYRSTP
jgi:PPOX class probable FMN-dependent enzyme